MRQLSTGVSKIENKKTCLGKRTLSPPPPKKGGEEIVSFLIPTFSFRSLIWGQCCHLWVAKRCQIFPAKYVTWTQIFCAFQTINKTDPLQNFCLHAIFFFGGGGCGMCRMATLPPVLISFSPVVRSKVQTKQDVFLKMLFSTTICSRRLSPNQTDVKLNL